MSTWRFRDLLLEAGRYVAATSILNLLWEVAQLPLYTIWTTGTFGEIAFAVVHCTGGDALIAFGCLSASLVIFAALKWPCRRFGAVAVCTILLGVGYTVYSEWHNTVVARTWAYSSWMPTVLGIGFSPIAQWVFVPGFVFWWTHRRTSKSSSTVPLAFDTGQAGGGHGDR